MKSQMRWNGLPTLHVFLLLITIEIMQVLLSSRKGAAPIGFDNYLKKWVSINKGEDTYVVDHFEEVRRRQNNIILL